MPYFTSDKSVLGPAGVAPLLNYTPIDQATNAILQTSKAKAQVHFHLYNEPLSDGTPINRAFGDVRWNMLRWLESPYQTNSFVGGTANVSDPRTGRDAERGHRLRELRGQGLLRRPD